MSNGRVCSERCIATTGRRRNEKAELEAAGRRAFEALERARIVLTAEEAGRIEVADFGLGRLENTGLELVVYVDTERVVPKNSCSFRTGHARSITIRWRPAREAD